MRLPLWMGMLSVAGSMCAVVPAYAQQEEAPKAVQPAQSAQVDPAAKKALEEAVEAVKNLGPCTFTVKMETEGLGNFAFDASLSVKMIRGKNKDSHSYQMLGEFKAPGGKPDDTKVNAAMIEGKMGEWIDADPKVKTLFIRPTKGVKPADQAGKDVLTKTMTPSKAFDVMFLEAEPFKAELKAPELTMEKAATVNGEECQVVKATLQGGTAYRLVYISALDKLPRKYEQFMGKPGPGIKQQIRRFEIKDLNTEGKLSLDDIHLKAPEGFKTDKVDAPPPPPPPPPAAPKGEQKNEKGADPDAKPDPNAKPDPVKEKLNEKEREKKKDADRVKSKVPSHDPNPDSPTAKPGNN